MPVSRREETSLGLSVVERHNSHRDAVSRREASRLRKTPSTRSDGTLCEKLHKKKKNITLELTRLQVLNWMSQLVLPLLLIV